MPSPGVWRATASISSSTTAPTAPAPRRPSPRSPPRRRRAAARLRRRRPARLRSDDRSRSRGQRRLLRGRPQRRHRARQRLPGDDRRGLGRGAAHQPRRLLQRAAAAHDADGLGAPRRTHRDAVLGVGHRRQSRPGQLQRRQGRHHRRDQGARDRAGEAQHHRQLRGARPDRDRHDRRCAARGALKLVPMRRVGRPDEVAAAVSFLCPTTPATSRAR